MQERLDRGFENTGWKELFSEAEVRVWDMSTSDHRPLFLQTNRQVYAPKKRRFRFENIWVRENDCYNVVKNSWESTATGKLWSASNIVA